MAELLAGVSHQAYHRDELPGAPHFSRSVAVTLLERSPLHAWSEHPQLGGQAPKKASDAMDMGSLIHALLLGSGPDVVVVEADNYYTKAAKAARDEARAAGRLPILLKDWEEAQETARQLGPKLVDCGIPILECEREATLLWEEMEHRDVIPGDMDLVKPTFCKARADYVLLHSEPIVLWDLKVMDKMNVWGFQRSTLRYGLDIQAYTYTAAVESIFDAAGEVGFEFVLVESQRPWDVAIIPASTSLMAMGAARWGRALAIWRQAMETGDWHGTGRLAPVEAPPQALESERLSGLSPEEKLDALFGNDDDDEGGEGDDQS